ncbi:hypothetical protein HK102_010566 [Quaeritorhiza haematococci]|nr:hypothetical protein HK102_010566 [Quaeritorhiza haematococci]
MKPTTPTLPFDVQFRRLVDSRILRDNLPAQSLSTLTTLHKILSNILSHPSEPKYRKLRGRNKLVHDSILSVLGGEEALIAVGFLKRVEQFEEYFVLVGEGGQGLEKVKVARDILEEYLGKAVEKAEREERQKFLAATEGM